MLAKLDNFAFTMNKNHFKALEESFKWHFEEHKQLGFNSTYQAVNGRSHSVTLRGLLVQKKLKALDPLIAIGDKKQPVRFTTATSDYYVLIEGINRGKDKFNNDGSYMVQTFDITLKQVDSPVMGAVGQILKV